MMRRSLQGLLIAMACGLVGVHAAAQGKPIAGENTDFTSSLNKADRVDWFRDQGFGLFIHWSE
jgi:alpha-L-fucosidase